MTPKIKSKKITYEVEFNSYIYDVVEYYDQNNSLVADIISVDGMPIDTRSYAIRNKILGFIKENKLTLN